MKTTLKRSKTHTEYTTKYGSYEIIVPAGWPVSNGTALGPDDNIRFAQDPHKLARLVTGLRDSILRHDLEYYGLNIPAEYCEPYKKLYLVKLQEEKDSSGRVSDRLMAGTSREAAETWVGIAEGHGYCLGRTYCRVQEVDAMGNKTTVAEWIILRGEWEEIALLSHPRSAAI
jgi:hypothetical protein